MSLNSFVTYVLDSYIHNGGYESKKELELHAGTFEILFFFLHRRSHRRADMPKCLSFLPVVLDAHSAELRYATHAHA